MPRDGSGVFTTLAGTHGIPDTTVASTPYNLNVDDVATDLNAPRPIIAGGTGSSTALGARDNLDAERSNQVVTNFSSQVWEFGSFSSAAGATDAPTANAFAGIVYGTDANHLVVEARDQSTGTVYVRRKVGGVWQGSSPFWTVDYETGNLAITVNADTTTFVEVNNNHAGPGAAAALRVTNGSKTGFYGLKGTGGTAYGGWLANEAAVYNSGNVVIMADEPAGVIKFAARGSATAVTLDVDGLRLNKAASGLYTAVLGQMNGNFRWGVILGTTDAESGSNTGSNFAIARFADNGAGIDSPFVINRATGNLTLSGKLDLGTGANLNGSKLNISSATSTWHTFMLAPNAGAGGQGLLLGQGPNDNTDGASIYIGFWDFALNAQRGSISRNGANIAYNTTSDERLKTVQGRTGRGLKALMDIFVPDYTQGDETVRQGLLAQQLHKIYPEAVTVGGDDPHKEPWGVDYGRITPLIIAAMQDYVAETNKRLAALEQLLR